MSSLFTPTSYVQNLQSYRGLMLPPLRLVTMFPFWTFVSSWLFSVACYLAEMTPIHLRSYTTLNCLFCGSCLFAKVSMILEIVNEITTTEVKVFNCLNLMAVNHKLTNSKFLQFNLTTLWFGRQKGVWDIGGANIFLSHLTPKGLRCVSLWD